MELMLNELSLITKSHNVESAAQLLSSLVEVIARANQLGFELMYTPISLLQTEVCNNYSVFQWINDDRFDIPERQLLLTASATGPYLEEALDPVRSTEVFFEGVKVLGLELAFARSGYAISLRSEARFDKPALEVEVRQVDANFNLVEQVHSIPHVSRSTHFNEHEPFPNQPNLDRISRGRELWRGRAEYFPALAFCASAEEFIKKEGNSAQLKGAIKMLAALNSYASEILGAGAGEFRPDRINCENSPESEQTLGISRLKRMREFVCPDGEERLFSWHVKDYYSNWRVHFICERQWPRPILIGYIGKHLETATDY